MAKIQTNGSGSVYTVNGSVLLTDDSGGGSSGTRDVTLTRISDDNGNEIGTWYMNFADANGNEYKVVCLDAQYRNSSVAWCSNTSAVTDMPLYHGLKGLNVWEAGETATQNTQLILDYCTAGGYTSTACSHCRSKSFTIGGITYYGQLPNMIEVIHIAKHYHEFDSLDISASSQPSLIFLSPMSINMWSSNQSSKNAYAFYLTYEGFVAHFSKPNTQFVCPVLEIPA